MPFGSRPVSPPGPPPTSSTSASPTTPRFTPASLTPSPRYMLGVLRLLHATTALARARFRLLPTPIPPTKSTILMTTIVSRIQEFSLLLSFLDRIPPPFLLARLSGPDRNGVTVPNTDSCMGGSPCPPRPRVAKSSIPSPVLGSANYIGLETYWAGNILDMKRLPVGADIQHTRRWWAAIQRRNYNKIERGTKDAN